MTGILAELRNQILILKMVMLRMGSYISLANIGMIMFLTLSSLKDKGYIHIDISSYMIPIYIGTIIFFLIIGYLELYVFKGFTTDQNIQWKFTQLHPEMQDMKRKVDILFDERDRTEHNEKN